MPTLRGRAEQPDGSILTDVLVVGAGPSGLMLANRLAASGVDCIVIDGKSEPTRESRAIVVQARSMELYDQLGLADRMLEASHTAAVVVPGFGRRRFRPVPIGRLGEGSTPFNRLYFLEQSRNEALLYDNLRRLGGDVLWRHHLVSVVTDARGAVTATVQSGEETRVISARYCVGADGAGSTVRQLRGIPFEGTTGEGLFYVCDALGVEYLVEDAVNVRLSDRGILLTFPMTGGGHHRLIGTAPAEAPDLESAEHSVRTQLAERFGVRWGESAWFSTYHVHHRVAARFRDGPFFLVGDAAHVHSPIGGQGMNTGLQDAHNLALAMVDVLRGAAVDSSLDRYEAERRPVALRLVSTTDRLFGLATSTSFPLRLLRRLVITTVGPIAAHLIPRLPGAGRLFEYVSQVRVHYWMSDAARASGRRDPVVGRRLPWSGDNFASLRMARWQVHEYGKSDAVVVAAIEQGLGLPVEIFEPDARMKLVPGVFYLVRPDGFVAAAAAAGTVAATAAAVRILLAVMPEGIRPGNALGPVPAQV